MSSTNILPTELYAFGIRFRVEVVDGLPEDTSGETDLILRLIRVNSSLDTSRQWRTLYHEYLHCCYHVMGYSNEAHHEIEEMIVQTGEHAAEAFMTAFGKQYLTALESM